MSNLDLLRALVAAKLAYWDALRAFEVAAVPNGEFSDRASDAVISMVDYLASTCDSDVSIIDSKDCTSLVALANI